MLLLIWRASIQPLDLFLTNFQVWDSGIKHIILTLAPLLRPLLSLHSSFTLLVCLLLCSPTFFWNLILVFYLFSSPHSFSLAAFFFLDTFLCPLPYSCHHSFPRWPTATGISSTPVYAFFSSCHLYRFLCPGCLSFNAFEVHVGTQASLSFHSSFDWQCCDSLLSWLLFGWFRSHAAASTCSIVLIYISLLRSFILCLLIFYTFLLRFPSSRASSGLALHLAWRAAALLGAAFSSWLLRSWLSALSWRLLSLTLINSSLLLHLASLTFFPASSEFSRDILPLSFGIHFLSWLFTSLYQILHPCI
jgi:hypothetical protein